MTPKEKAKELVNKFIPYSYFSDGNNSMERDYEKEDNAKQCALIAVDEMLKELDRIAEHYWIDVDYWQEVKKEIEKL